MSDEIKNGEVQEAIKPLTDNDEIKEFNKEVLGKLDSPLVVHIKGDASYEEDTSAFEMNETHTDEERPTLVRHRFKKEKKSKGGLLAFIFIVFAFAGVFAALYYTGNITFSGRETTTVTTTEATTVTTTSIEQNYKGKIVIKAFIFLLTARRLTEFRDFRTRLNTLTRVRLHMRLLTNTQILIYLTETCF